MTGPVSTARWTATALAAALAVAGPAAAQPTGGDGFLFGEPPGALTLRGGLGTATAGGDVFGDATRHLTLGRGDFVGGSAAAELALRLADSRLQLVFGSGLTAASADSEFRDWVEEGPTASEDDDLPIRQTTSFYRVPVTLGLKMYVTPQGRSIGRYAWVPARFAPYVGAGGGVMWYRYRQEGDFVDFETGRIFEDLLESSGWGPAAYAGGGVDFTLSPHVALTGDARYQYGRARPNAAFEGFERLDLSGVITTFGVNFRF